jgi:hypothetical protein
LAKKLAELVADGEEIAVSDAAFPFTLRFKASYK